MRGFFRSLGLFSIGLYSMSLFAVETAPEVLRSTHPASAQNAEIQHSPLLPDLLLSRSGEKTLASDESGATSNPILAEPKLKLPKKVTPVTSELPLANLPPKALDTKPILLEEELVIVKPVEVKPVEAKTAEAKPIVVKPAEVKPVTKQEVKTQEKKPTETAVVSNTKAQTKTSGSPAARLPYTDPETNKTISTLAPNTTSNKADSVKVANAQIPKSGMEDFVGVLGQNTSVTLNGSGWLYLGPEAGTEGIVYLSSKIQKEETVFSFRLEKAGTKMLRFQRQDGLNAKLETSTVSLGVFTKAEFPAIEATRAQRTSEKLSALDANKTTNKNTVAERSNVDPALTLSPGLQEKVSLGYSELVLPPLANELFQLAGNLETAGRASEAALAYKTFVSNFPNEKEVPEAMYRRARLLEAQTDKTVLKEAFDLYVSLQKLYPYSNRVEEARQRARYLDRNFFSVR